MRLRLRRRGAADPHEAGNSLRMRLFLVSLTLILTVVVSFYFLSYWMLTNLMVEKQADNEINTFKQADSYLRSYYGNVERYIQKLADRPELAAALTRPYEQGDFADINERITDLSLAVEGSFNYDKYIDDIFIVGANDFIFDYTWGLSGKYVGAPFDFSAYFYSGRFTDRMDKPLYDGSTAMAGGGPLLQASSDRIVYLKMLQRTDSSAYGAVVVTIDKKLLSDYFSEVSEKQAIYLADSGGRPLWTNVAWSGPAAYVPHPSGSASGYDVLKSRGGRTAAIYYDVPHDGVQFRSEIPVASIMDRSGEIRTYTLAYAGGCLLFELLASYYAAGLLGKPLTRLARTLSGIRSLSSVEPMSGIDVPLGRFGLRVKIVGYFMIVVIVPGLLFMTISTVRDYEIYRDKVTEFTVNTIHVAKWNLTYSLTTYEDMTRQMVFSDTIQQLMEKSDGGPVSAQDAEGVERLFFDVKMNRKEFLAINLYNANGMRIYSGSAQGQTDTPSLSAEELEALKGSRGRLILIETQKEVNANPVLLFARAIRGSGDGNFARTEGYMTFSIDADALYGTIQRIKPADSDVDYFLVDGQNRLIRYSNDAWEAEESAFLPALAERMGPGNGAFTAKNGSSASLLFYDRLEDNGLTIVGVVPAKEIQSKLYPLVGYGIAGLLLYGAVILFLSSFFASHITKPLRTLNRLMESVKEGNLNKTMVYRGRDEVAILSRQYNSMMERLRELIRENVESKLRESELLTLQREAQLRTLQQQINPHFLYNTLDSIKWVAYVHGVTEISEMASALGKFFRGSIQSKERVTFAEEIEHLQSYIYIQQIRYQERFNVRFEIDEEVYRCQTVKLVLQPIVENALNHGIDGLESGGVVTIRARLRDGIVSLEIEDNGVGMSAERLAEIRAKCLNASPESADSHIGISNVYRRLTLHFGDSCTFDIASEEGRGTIVRFSIPAVYP